MTTRVGPRSVPVAPPQLTLTHAALLEATYYTVAEAVGDGVSEDAIVEALRAANYDTDAATAALLPPPKKAAPPAKSDTPAKKPTPDASGGAGAGAGKSQGGSRSSEDGGDGRSGDSPSAGRAKPPPAPTPVLRSISIGGPAAPAPPEAAAPASRAPTGRPPLPTRGVSASSGGGGGGGASASVGRGSPAPSDSGTSAGRASPVVIDVVDDEPPAKPLLNLVVVGHVDAGKSTLMGHLLYDLGHVSNKELHRFEKQSREVGKASFAYAWVLDQHDEEVRTARAAQTRRIGAYTCDITRSDRAG